MDDIVKRYQLTYERPSREGYTGWENDALPIGNGNIGNKIFGFIGREQIQFNEKTLWSGGPGATDKVPGKTEYNGGNDDERYPYLPEIRSLLEQGNITQAKQIAEAQLVGPADIRCGRYLNFGNVLIDFSNQSKLADSVTDYRRSLNISDALHTVHYVQDGVAYDRESFVSCPDQVSVTELRVDREGKLNFALTIDGDNRNRDASDSGAKDYSTQRVGEGLLLGGTVKDNGMRFAAYIKVLTDGEIAYADRVLTVKNASRATAIFGALTDYVLDYAQDYKDSSVDLDQAVMETVEQAAAKGYKNLKARHVDDYKALFDRFCIDLSEQKDMDTDQLLRRYRQEPENSVEELFTQFGRYLLIASSRDDGERRHTLPANLQGIWNGCDNPPWNSDYHLNINLQMNYWPAFTTNLAETAIPLVNYIDDMRYYGRIAAARYAGIKSSGDEQNGWLTHTQNTPFGWTTPGWNYNWGWSPAANAWIMENVYNDYQYTADRSYLTNKIYPMLKETAKFWDQFLHDDVSSGRFVSSPAYSPEHGTLSIGNTFDQSLVWELFKNYLEAAGIVGDTDELVGRIRDKIAKLSPLQLNQAGHIKEWYEEDSPAFTGEAVQAQHRHVSQLVGLYPGSLFDKDNREMFDAARATLNDRGDGGTGWAKANKINLWARLLDGNRAHKLLTDQLKSSTLNNLWDTHPPFQIDGNLGATSGVAEMLLQSHLGRLQLLPALPDAYASGRVRGIVGRGNFVVDMDWADKQLSRARITAVKGGDLILDYRNIALAEIQLNAAAADFEKISNDRVKLRTNAGDIVTIGFCLP